MGGVPDASIKSPFCRDSPSWLLPQVGRDLLAAGGEVPVEGLRLMESRDSPSWLLPQIPVFFCFSTTRSSNAIRVDFFDR